MQRALFTAVWLILSVTSSVNLIGAASARQDTNPITLRVAMPAPENLDPTQLSRFDQHTRDVVENLFVGLTRFDPVTRTAEPAIAEDWSISDDGLTWTFNLREDVYWVRYDSATEDVEAVRQVVAGDMVYAIQRACDPLRPSPVTANLMIIQGCQTVADAFPQVIDDIFIAREIGVRATGPHTLEIELLFPASYFPTLLSTPELRPLPRESLHDTQDMRRGQMLLTSGPYTLQSWTVSDMTLIRNPHWPEPYAGNAEQVAITFTNETFNTLNLIRNESVDAGRLEPGQIAAAQSGDLDRVTITRGGTLWGLGYSYERAVVGSSDARRALSAALDRAALASIFNGTMLPAEQFTLPETVAAPQPEYTLTDIAGARTAFDLAGFPGCNNIPEPLIVLVPDDDPVWTELGSAITGQWANILGCNPALFEVKSVPRTLLIELSHANYDPEQVTRSHMWLFTWNADYPDAHAWIHDAIHCRYGYIRNGRPCSPVDDLLDEAGVSFDAGTRADDYTQAETLLFGSSGAFPVTPLLATADAWIVQPWADGPTGTSAARYDLWTVNADAQPPA